MIDKKLRSLGPLPLVIGITGHRDLRLEDLKKLKNKVCSIFEELHTKYPHTPLILLSPLAEGADRLVAQEAVNLNKKLEKKFDIKPIKLIVPLPMRRELYEKDFDTSASRTEFAKLLQDADQHFELPMLPDYNEEDIRESGEPRNQHYAQVGAYIVRHSQILIALWDGVDLGLEGGTDQIVRFNLEGVPEPYAPRRSPLDSVETGPVYYLVTPRRNSPSPVAKALTLCKLFPQGYESDAAAEVAYDRIYKRMDIFNWDAIRLKSKLIEQRRKSKENLLTEDLNQIETIPEPLKFILNRYAIADSLSIYFHQQRYLPTLLSLFILAFLVLFFFEVYDNLFPKKPLALFLHIFVLSLVFGFYKFAKQADYESKYLDYRALAEGLRVQFFWSIFGIENSVADHYLRKQRSELDWIRNATRIFWVMAHSWQSNAISSVKEPELASRASLVQKHWIEAQNNYFAKKAQQNHEQLECYERWFKRFFLVGLILVGILLILHILVSYFGILKLDSLVFMRDWLYDLQNPEPPKGSVPTARSLLIIGMSSALFLSALVNEYSEKRALSKHAKQYQRMWMIFNKARHHFQHLKEAGEYEEAKKFIRELGEEALTENGDWVQLHRDRPMEVPL